MPNIVFLGPVMHMCMRCISWLQIITTTNITTTVTNNNITTTNTTTTTTTIIIIIIIIIIVTFYLPKAPVMVFYSSKYDRLSEKPNLVVS